ncbi:Chromatin remodeling protein ebs [Thalictrum thalictroides]|uniref:Chromatin remodeling protein ebs n=1 Tax=Thalictrum thalictroides TaxID=46969 RepID=A0A7J6V4Z7_THATH|nr:Chromatin remodeling protein ebs [Thalictrum thalictroides]
MKIEDHGNGQVKVHVCKYYKPEETSSWGKRSFHGAKELVISDHTVIESVDEIEGKCIVHTLEDYRKLKPVATEDYYCRFAYNITTDTITMRSEPYDRDVVFHPSCIDLTEQEAKMLDGYVCDDCYSDMTKTNNRPAGNTKEQEEIDLWNGVEVKD